MTLSAKQMEKFSELCLDIAKGLFLSALAVSIIDRSATIFETLRAIISGLLFTYLSLKAVELSELVDKR